MSERRRVLAVAHSGKNDIRIPLILVQRIDH